MTSSENAVQRYFRYRLPEWPLRTDTFKTAQISALCNETGCHLDMVGDATRRRLFIEGGLSVGSLVPGFGESGMWEAPFFPGMHKGSQKAAVQKKIATTIATAANDGVKYVVVFTGKNTHASRASQFKAIREGFTQPCDALGGQMSLVEHAAASGVTLVVEPLNTKGEGPMKGHADYLGWNPLELVKELVEPIGSPWFKLVLDIFHTRKMNLDPVKVIGQVHDHTAYVHVAGMMVAQEGHHPKDRGELTLGGQVIDYPAVMAELAKHFAPGTLDVLFEFIPTTPRHEGEEPDEAATATELRLITANVNAAITLCESNVPDVPTEQPVAAVQPQPCGSLPTGYGL